MTECYICSRESVSQEHVPPICLFPESKDVPPGSDYRKNLITVPSCDEHNLHKSGDDEYLLYVLVANFNVNSAGLRQWATKLTRSMSRRPTKRGIFRNLIPVMFRGVNTGAYEVDIDRVSRQMDWISRGIYYHHFHKHWPYEITSVSSALMAIGSPEAERQNKAIRVATDLGTQFLKSETKLGDNPEIFFYQYKLRSDPLGFVIRMVFYGGIDVVAISGPEIKPMAQAA